MVSNASIQEGKRRFTGSPTARRAGGEELLTTTPSHLDVRSLAPVLRNPSSFDRSRLSTGRQLM